jgi:CHAD domain-containing protein
MAYEFKQKENVGKAIGRLCLERIESSLKELKSTMEPEGVHEIRKNVKKVRGTLRLVRGELPKSKFKACSRVLRQIAKFLADARDSKVKIETLDELENQTKGEPFTNGREILEREFQEAMESFKKLSSVEKIQDLLQELEREIEKINLKFDGWSAIEPGVRSAFTEGRKALQMVQCDPTDTRWHEWRKRAKDSWYHLRLIEPAWPGGLKPSVDVLAKLTDDLGKRHDLVVLRDALELPEDEDKRLELAIENQLEELERNALYIGVRFYGEKPGAFCRRLKISWENWKQEGEVPD